MYKHSHSPSNMGRMAGLTSSVKFLLILNIAIYFVDSFTNPDPRYRMLARTFALQAHWWQHLEVGQLFTYMFIHGGFSHLLMNMMALFFIGPTVERTLGSFRFFILYYLSGILGGLGWSLLADSGYSCVGASGAIMGILGAFAALYPNAEVRLLLFPFFPIKAWKLVAGIMVLEFIQTFVHPLYGGIANAAHLMGGVAGFSYVMALKHPQVVDTLKSKLPGFKSAAARKPPRQSPSRSPTLSKEEIDRILDKIGREGMGALTTREREMLRRATR